MLQEIKNFVQTVICFGIVISTVLTDSSFDETISIIKCGRRGQLYSDQDKNCHEPFSIGPCFTTEIILLNKDTLKGKCESNSGYVQCSSEIESVWNGTSCIEAHNNNECKGAGKRLVETLTGELKCECEDGWVLHDGKCYQYSTQAWCPHSEILQETEKCNCVPYTKCDTFLEDAASLSNLRMTNTTQYMQGVHRLAAMVCRQEEKMVCCPDSSRISKPFSEGELSEIIKGFYQTKKAGCAKSFCQDDSLPWPGKPGECFHAAEDIAKGRSDCELTLDDEDEEVNCRPNIGLRGVPGAFKRKCRRGQLWSKYRSKCVRKFF